MISHYKKTIFLLFFPAAVLVAMPPVTFQEIKDGYRIQLQVPSPVLTKEKVVAETKDGLSVDEIFIIAVVPGFGDYAGADGDPAVVSDRFQIAIEGGAPSVSIDNVITRDYILEGKLFPIQPPELYGEPKPPFTYNPESYKQALDNKKASCNKKSYAVISRTFTYRFQKCAIVEINPVRYDPSANRLTVVERMTIIIKTEKPAVVHSGHSKAFDRIMRSTFSNLDSVPAESFSTEEYLIITMPEYENNASLQEFIAFRSEQYDVTVVTTEDVGGSSIDDFRDFVRSEMPTFCLLVGNESEFPCWETSSWHSYNYYVATQVSSSREKPEPDISLGLFYIENGNEITNIVDKTIYTEKNLSTMPKICYGQGGNTQIMGNLPASHCDNVVEEMFQDYFSDYTCHFYKTNEGGRQAGVEEFNNGVKFNLYNGHGSTSRQAYGWGASDLSDMNNTVYPFVLTSACHTGYFDDDCVAAAAVADEHGPVVYIGSHESSNHGQHVLMKGYCHALMSEQITRNGLAFLYGVNSNTAPRAISDYTSVSSSQKARMGWQYHYFGDPAIETMESATPVVSQDALPVGSIPTLSVRQNSGHLILSIAGETSGKARIAIVDCKGRTVFSEGLRQRQRVTWHYKGSCAAGMCIAVFTDHNRQYRVPCILQ